ncbi:MAG: MgtC/SapB family protein [Agriterribacter sp.]
MDYEILIRFLLAALWGGIVGAEREYHSKSAGFRTMIMISMGSCFFTIMSVQIGQAANPDRIAANIVTGIGFLGAGVIFRGENRVNGITTAATIWAVAAVGMGIGAGYYFAAACGCVLMLIVLAILPLVENIIDKSNQSKVYIIKYHFDDDMKTRSEHLLKEHHLKYKVSKQIKEGGEMCVSWVVQGHSKCHEAFAAAMLKENYILSFEY